MSHTTRHFRHFKASREQVYRALLDGQAIARWRSPDGMSCRVHEFEPRVGGRIRVSLTYTVPGQEGKTTSGTDTYHGTFKELVANQKVVEVDEFESDRPELLGKMTLTYLLTDAPGGGTDLHATHEGVPDAVSPQDNELGWSMALEKLARLVEGR